MKNWRKIEILILLNSFARALLSFYFRFPFDVSCRKKNFYTALNVLKNWILSVVIQSAPRDLISHFIILKFIRFALLHATKQVEQVELCYHVRKSHEKLCHFYENEKQLSHSFFACFKERQIISAECLRRILFLPPIFLLNFFSVVRLFSGSVLVKCFSLLRRRWKITKYLWHDKV